MNRLKQALLGLSLLVFLAFAHAQSPVELRSEVFIVSEVTTDSGSKEERYSQADSAIPGQIVEYRIFAKNRGDTTLPEGRVRIATGIDEFFAYVEGTASPDDGSFLIEFSADGETYSEAPLIVGEGDDRSIISPADYTHIRWTYLKALEPGEEVTVRYRLKVLD